MNQLQSGSIEQLTAEIRILKHQTAVNIIEIGSRLIKAKEMLPHGEWGKWLEGRVEFSKSTANNFMRVAKEFSNFQAIGDLPPTKVFALLDVSAEDRERFIQEPQQLPTGETKTVNEMTTRELQEAIKARKVAEKAAKEAEARAKVAEHKLFEVQNQEPTIIEKVIEVIPSDVERELLNARVAITDHTRLSDENKRLKLELEATKASTLNGTLTMEAKVSTFTGRIKIFLREMAPLGYLGHEVMGTSPQAQKEYERAIAALERWCGDMRDAMVRPREEKTIDVEVMK